MLRVIFVSECVLVSGKKTVRTSASCSAFHAVEDAPRYVPTGVARCDERLKPPRSPRKSSVWSLVYLLL